MKTGTGRLKLYRAISVAMLAFSAYLYFVAVSRHSAAQADSTWFVEDILAIVIFLAGVALLTFSTYRLKSDEGRKG